jgi:rhodanese-related sulfurtransferase
MSKPKKRILRASDFTAADVREMHKLSLAGWQDHQICERYNCSEHTVGTLLSRVMPSGKIIHRNLTQQHKEAADYLRELGVKNVRTHATACAGHSKAWIRAYVWRLNNSHRDFFGPAECITRDHITRR